MSLGNTLKTFKKLVRHFTKFLSDKFNYKFISHNTIFFLYYWRHRGHNGYCHKNRIGCWVQILDKVDFAFPKQESTSPVTTERTFALVGNQFKRRISVFKTRSQFIWNMAYCRELLSGGYIVGNNLLTDGFLFSCLAIFMEVLYKFYCYMVDRLEEIVIWSGWTNKYLYFGSYVYLCFNNSG